MINQANHDTSPRTLRKAFARAASLQGCLRIMN